MKKLILLCLMLAVTTAIAADAGLAWNEAVGAEGYYVYWRTPDAAYAGTEAVFFPVCGGYYDTVPGAICVDRADPAVTVTGLPDAPPVLVLALKGANEVGLSGFSLEVRKHNYVSDPPGNVRRTEAPPAPGP